MKSDDTLNTTPRIRLHWVLINETERHVSKKKLEMYHEYLYMPNDWTRVWTLDGELSNQIMNYSR